MAACRRHELTEPSREHTSPLREASALALQLGASLGVTPRCIQTGCRRIAAHVAIRRISSRND
jgi:hypothetical protein